MTDEMDKALEQIIEDFRRIRDAAPPVEIDEEHAWKVGRKFSVQFGDRCNEKKL